jgi:hypothetical protein
VLIGCGGGARLGGGREGAAQALYTVSQLPLQKGASGSLGNGLVTITQTASCVHGGTVALRYAVDAWPIDGTLFPTVQLGSTYSGCSMDGKTVINGDLQLTMGSPVAGTYGLKMVGRVQLSGEIDDFVEADAEETVSATHAVSDVGQSVSIRLSGTIRTHAGTHEYADEVLVFIAGRFTPDTGT